MRSSQQQYNNLPPQQRMTQRMADQFNADERLWRNLEGKRKRRRELGSRLSKKQHSSLIISNSPRLVRRRIA
jgi:hypothetical protein